MAKSAVEHILKTVSLKLISSPLFVLTVFWFLFFSAGGIVCQYFSPRINKMRVLLRGLELRGSTRLLREKTMVTNWSTWDLPKRIFTAELLTSLKMTPICRSPHSINSLMEPWILTSGFEADLRCRLVAGQMYFFQDSWGNGLSNNFDQCQYRLV